MRSPRNAIAKFTALRADKRRALVFASAALPAIRVALPFIGLPRLDAWLKGRVVPGVRTLSCDDARALARLVDLAAARILGPGNCLSRSLVLAWLLRRRGADGRLRIGVRKAQQSLSAHAWVELDGVPVNDRADIGSEYASFGDLVPLSAFRQ